MLIAEAQQRALIYCVWGLEVPVVWVLAQWHLLCLLPRLES